MRKLSARCRFVVLSLTRTLLFTITIHKQIHPHGWCALSRNTSYDESSEWTCVHDIQEMDSEDEEPPIPEVLQENMFSSHQPDGSETNSEIVPFSSNASNNSDTSASNEASSSNTNETSDQNRPLPNPPNIQIDPPSDGDNDNDGLSVHNEENLDEDQQAIPYHAATLRPSLINTEEILDLWTGNIPFYQRSRRTLTERPQRVNTGILSMNPRNIRRPNIKQNRTRLLYYAAEPNRGKGFIKEVRIACCTDCSLGSLIASSSSFVSAVTVV